MQKSPQFYFALLLSLLFVTSCAKNELDTDLTESPQPQLFCVPTTSCPSLGSGWGNGLLMTTWAPYIESALDPGKTESPSGNLSCTNTNQTTTKTHTLCWPSDGQYSGCVAGDEVCRLADWARTNRPPSISGNFFSINRWYITSYSYKHVPDAPCSNHCSDPAPLKMDVTYTKYHCTLMEQSPQNLQVVRTNVVAGPGGVVTGKSDGKLEVTCRLDNGGGGGDDETPQIKMTIRGPNGQVLMEVLSAPHSDPEIHDQVLTFEIEDYSITECTSTFEWI